ncbi:hypothetical protein [Frigoribacterium sp. Leaf172]|uniref:hypothetical protein n=1 Tax=Frigoribacterium sp. Leaf172 TaxID=1736285 RepID=UPI0012E73F10|nr:hypothetical protein [Frigoribacterium sp. Leaf172]
MMNAPATAPGSVARVVYPSLVGPGSDRAAAREADDVRAEARGHAAGYAAGLRAAELELTARRAVLEAEHSDLVQRLQAHALAAADALSAAARALDACVVRTVADAEEALVASAFELAEAVVGYELRASEPESSPAAPAGPAGADGAADAAGAGPAAADGAACGIDAPAVAPAEPGADPRVGRTARAAVARALDGAAGGVVTTIRMHPLDLALLDESTRASSAPGAVFAPDASLARGDAEADLPAGLIDARLGTALDRARRALLGPASTGAAS